MITQALMSLRPGAEWTLNGSNFSDLYWLDKTQFKPTEKEVNDEIARLKSLEPQKKTNEEARNYLSFTDWYVIRNQETGVAIPEDILTKRAEARSSIIKL